MKIAPLVLLVFLVVAIPGFADITPVGGIMYGDSWGQNFKLTSDATIEGEPAPTFNYIIADQLSGDRFEGFRSPATENDPLPNWLTYTETDSLLRATVIGPAVTTLTLGLWFHGKEGVNAPLSTPVTFRLLGLNVNDGTTEIVTAYNFSYSLDAQGTGKWTRSLCCDCETPSVPEPSSALLLSTMLLGTGFSLRRRFC